MYGGIKIKPVQCIQWLVHFVSTEIPHRRVDSTACEWSRIGYFVPIRNDGAC